MNKLQLAILILVALTSTGAQAKEADTLRVIDVEEVLVIATPKETRKLRELPNAVTLLSQKEMQAAQINSIKNLTAIVPNIFIPDYGSRLTTAIYIRGIGSRINTPSVGLYVDNIPYIDKSAFDFNYSDVERIDVLRGPQGTLYGRNAMGGLIKIHTKSPFTYQGTDLRIGAATHNTYNTSVTHYHRLNDRFAFSAGGFYDYSGGFFRNSAPSKQGEKIDKAQTAGARFRGIYLPGNNWKIDLSLNYEYNDQGGYPYFYTGKTTPTSQPDPSASYIGKIAYNDDAGYRRNLLNAGLNVEHRAKNFTLSFVTGYQHLKDNMRLDQDFSAQNIYTIEQKQRINVISEEVILKSKEHQRWQWTTGAFGFYQWLNTQAPVNFKEDGMKMMKQMMGTVMPPEIIVPTGPTNMHIKPALNVTSNALPINGDFNTPLLNAALYHQSTVHRLLGIQGLSLTAGLRLDYEQMKINYNSGCALDYTLGITGEIRNGEQLIREIEMMPQEALTVKSGYEGSIKKEYLQLLPKMALQYDLKKGKGNIYFSLSKGYRSGGYNIQMFSDLLQTSLRNDMMKQAKEVVTERAPENFKEIIANSFPDAPQNPEAQAAIIYKPEYTWSYEIGTHLNLLENRLRIDAAAFLLDTRDQQISRFAKSGLGRETVNAGKSRSKGAEIAIMAALTNDLALTTSYGYTHAVFKEYVTTNSRLEEINYNGNYVPFVPKHTFSMGAQYTVHIKKGGWIERVQLNANYTGAGRIYWTEQNNTSQAFYATLNGRVSLQKGPGQIDFWVRNALKEEYAAFYFESMGNGFMQKGRPIQAGIEVRCRF